MLIKFEDNSDNAKLQNFISKLNSQDYAYFHINATQDESDDDTQENNDFKFDSESDTETNNSFDFDSEPESDDEAQISQPTIPIKNQLKRNATQVITTKKQNNTDFEFTSDNESNAKPKVTRLATTIKKQRKRNATQFKTTKFQNNLDIEFTSDNESNDETEQLTKLIQQSTKLLDYIKTNKLRYLSLQVKKDEHNKITNICGSNTDIINFKTNNYKITTHTKTIAETLCYDTTTINCLIIYNNSLFEKHLKQHINTDLNQSTIHYTSNFDNQKYYLIKLIDIPESQKRCIIQIKYINHLICDILLGVGAHCDGKEILINPNLKPINLSYDIFVNVQTELNKINPNIKHSPLYDLSAIATKDLNPYKFKIVNYSNYNDNKAVVHFRGMSCAKKGKEGHVCDKKYTGNFHYGNRYHLYKFILENEVGANYYCMSERVTDYFKYFIDCDMNDEIISYLVKNNVKFSIDDFWQHVIGLLLVVMGNLIDVGDDKKLIEYLYAVKQDNPYKIHLHFPNLIISKKYALMIRQNLINMFKEKAVYNTGDLIYKIIDRSPYSTSLRLLNQKKCGDKFAYDVDIRKSTFKISSGEEYVRLCRKLGSKRGLNEGEKGKMLQIRFELMCITSISSHKRQINFGKKFDASGKAYLDYKLEEDNKSLHETNKKKNHKNIGGVPIIEKQKKTKNGEVVCIGDLDPKLTLDLTDDIEEFDRVCKERTTVIMDRHNKYSFKVTINFILKLILNLSHERLTHHREWLDLMFFCKNYGLENLAHQLSAGEDYDGGYINKIFNERKKCEKKDNICECRLISILHLISWNEEDNPEGLQKICNEDHESVFVEMPKRLINETEFKKGIEDYGYSGCLVEYEDDYVRKLSKDYKLNFVKSGLGTGKTFSAGDLVYGLLYPGGNSSLNIQPMCKKDYNSLLTVLSRQTLTANVAHSFNMKGIKVQHYKSRNIKYDSSVKVCTTPDSLLAFISEFDITKSPFDPTAYIFKAHVDIVCIDEIRSCLNYVATSSTLKDKRIPVFVALIHFLRNAKKIILMDGHLTAWDINYIFDVMKTNSDEENMKLLGSTSIVYNKMKTEKNNYFIRNSIGNMLCELVAVLKMGKNVFIGCDSKKYSKTLGEFIKCYYPNISLKVYTSDSDSMDKAEIGNCNETWKQYQVVIVSPIVVYGVDFNLKHFHRGFNFWFKILNPRGGHQQTMRVRKYVDDIVNVYVMGMSMRSVGNKSWISNYSKNNSKVTSTVQQLNVDEIVGGNVAEVVSVPKFTVEELFNKLNTHFMVESVNSKNFYAYELLNYLTEYGGTVYYDPLKKIKKSEYKEMTKKIDTIRTTSINRYYRMIIDAESSVEDYERIVEKENKTQEENFSIIAFRFKQVFGLDRLNTVFMEFVKDSFYIDKFKNSVIFSLDSKCLEEHLKEQRCVEFKGVVDNFLKKTEIVRSLLLLFFPDGIADNRVRIVSSHAEHLSEKEKEFIKKYKSLINVFFPNILQKQYHKNNKKKLSEEEQKLANYTKPITPKTLISWLDVMLQDYFGFGIVKVAPCVNKNIRVCIEKGIELISESYLRDSSKHYKNKKIDIKLVTDKKESVIVQNEVIKGNSLMRIYTSKPKQYIYYCYKLDNLMYLELLLNSKKSELDLSLINIAYKNFKDTECILKDLHDKSTIYDIIEIVHYNRNEKYFDDNEDYDIIEDVDKNDIMGIIDQGDKSNMETIFNDKIQKYKKNTI